jgi:hypothetical protein
VPWPTALVLRCPLTALPAHGQLSVRDVLLATRMGRTVRYLIPGIHYALTRVLRLPNTRPNWVHVAASNKVRTG